MGLNNYAIAGNATNKSLIIWSVRFATILSSLNIKLKNHQKQNSLSMLSVSMTTLLR